MASSFVSSFASTSVEVSSADVSTSADVFSSVELSSNSISAPGPDVSISTVLFSSTSGIVISYVNIDEVYLRDC